MALPLPNPINASATSAFTIMLPKPTQHAYRCVSSSSDSMFQMTEDLAWSLVYPFTAVFRFGPINPRSTSADTGSLILTCMFFAAVGSNTTLCLYLLKYPLLTCLLFGLRLHPSLRINDESFSLIICQLLQWDAPVQDTTVLSTASSDHFRY